MRTTPSGGERRHLEEDNVMWKRTTPCGREQRHVEENDDAWEIATLPGRSQRRLGDSPFTKNRHILPPSFCIACFTPATFANHRQPPCWSSPMLHLRCLRSCSSNRSASPMLLFKRERQVSDYSRASVPVSNFSSSSFAKLHL